MAEQQPPPTYSQRDPVVSVSTETHHHLSEESEPQILILPTADAVNFQKGFLGADGERAAIEGELQIKGADSRRWVRITVSVRSFEAAYHQDVELGYTEIELYSKQDPEDAIPSSIPFAIPLLPDTPQSIQTPHSLLAHTLTATLHAAADDECAPFSKRLTVHTRRYTSHSYSIPLAPETHTLDAPTRIEVQVPRNIYTSEEMVPLYVTVPPPSRETVIDQGLRLRNVRVELIRVVKVKREHLDDSETDSSEALDFNTEDDDDDDDEDFHLEGSSKLAPTRNDSSAPSSSTKPPLSPLFLGSTYRHIIAQSGASCRFHSSRSIQLRFLLHQNPAGSPSDSRSAVDRMDSDIESAMITQSTLLHMVSFHLKVYVSFVDTSSQRERISTIIIPVTILPPPAPLPQVSQAIDDAYQKKHDRPPARTVREEEFIDPSIPRYFENEAGPSMPHGGAPPPFEERDAPPPFFASAFEAEASSSSGLPTFQESEREIILPEAGHLMDDIPVVRTIPGEGDLFGFHPSQQFDGHSDQQSLTPPPSLDMNSHADLTTLTDPPSHITYESLGIVLDANETENGITEQRPPPPPAMDDPSDPPPSIDSEFRSPMIGQDSINATGPPLAPPPLHNAYHAPDSIGIHTSTPALPTDLAPSSEGHAPPPYLIPDNHREGPGDSDQVTRPPPYVD